VANSVLVTFPFMTSTCMQAKRKRSDKASTGLLDVQKWQSPRRSFAAVHSFEAGFRYSEVGTSVNEVPTSV
jgi:hypothetical protein